MHEHLDKLEEYWNLYDELGEKERLNYVWNTWGELILDVVREWEDETLDESILELKELVEAEKNEIQRLETK